MIPSVTALPLALLPPVQWMVSLLKPILVFFHDSIGLGWGMSIVMLTVCVRAVLAPLTVKQFKSMQAMVRVGPQLKELQAKYKDDKQRQQQEVMKFYADNKINPFASCLPLVAQMPFFIGLFYLLQSDLRREICGAVSGKPPPCGTLPHPTGAEQFLFIPDLTDKATGWVLGVLIVLYVGSQLLSSVLTPSTADRNQRLLMYALPFVFLIFIIRFPAGLLVYWITTNLWTVTQGYVLRQSMGPITAPVGAGAPSKPTLGGAPASGGGLMARLAAATGAGTAPKDAAKDADAKPAAKAGTSGAKPAASTSKPAGSKQRSTAPAGSKPAPRSRGASKSSDSKTAAASAEKPARSGPPPPSPRKKKKRSGRRR